MSRTFWIVSELYYPEETSTGYYLTKIAEGLAPYYPVNVLCAQPTYSARGVRAAQREHRAGVGIFRCRATTLNKDVMLYRLINTITIGASISAQAILQIRSKDVVLVVTNPPLLPFLVAIVCRFRGARCLLLIHDAYPEVLIAAGIIKKGSVSARTLDWVVVRLCRSVDRVIVIGRDMAKLFTEKIRRSQRVVVIPNWADSKEVTPGVRDQNILLKQLGLGDKFVVQYSGNMGRTQGLEVLLEAVNGMRDLSEVHFLFIGWGAKRNWLEAAIKEKRLQNITLLPYRHRTQLSDSLNACDVAIISLAPGMLGVSVPSRMYNILAAGKPIIAVGDGESELAQVVEEERVGWVVPSGQPHQIAEVIREARENPKRLAEMGARARLVAENKYTLLRAIESYRDLICSIETSQE